MPRFHDAVLDGSTNVRATLSQLSANAPAAVRTSVAAAPERTGQIAVVGSTVYVATGTSSDADWRDVTVEGSGGGTSTTVPTVAELNASMGA